MAIQPIIPVNYRQHTLNILGKDILVGGMAAPDKNRNKEAAIAYLASNAKQAEDSAIKGLLIGLREQSYSELANRHRLIYEHLPIEDFTEAPPETYDKLYELVTDATNKNIPITIHCGAGDGRTGTAIASLKLREIIEREAKENPAILYQTPQINTSVYASMTREYIPCSPYIKEAVEKIRSERTTTENYRDNGSHSVETERDIHALIKYEQFVKNKLAIQQITAMLKNFDRNALQVLFTKINSLKQSTEDKNLKLMLQSLQDNIASKIQKKSRAVTAIKSFFNTPSSIITIISKLELISINSKLTQLSKYDSVDIFTTIQKQKETLKELDSLIAQSQDIESKNAFEKAKKDAQDMLVKFQLQAIQENIIIMEENPLYSPDKLNQLFTTTAEMIKNIKEVTQSQETAIIAQKSMNKLMLVSIKSRLAQLNKSFPKDIFTTIQKQKETLKELDSLIAQSQDIDSKNAFEKAKKDAQDMLVKFQLQAIQENIKELLIEKNPPVSPDKLNQLFTTTAEMIKNIQNCPSQLNPKFELLKTHLQLVEFKLIPKEDLKAKLDLFLRADIGESIINDKGYQQVVSNTYEQEIKKCSLKIKEKITNRHDHLKTLASIDEKIQYLETLREYFDIYEHIPYDEFIITQAYQIELEIITEKLLKIEEENPKDAMQQLNTLLQYSNKVKEQISKLAPTNTEFITQIDALIIQIKLNKALINPIDVNLLSNVIAAAKKSETPNLRKKLDEIKESNPWIYHFNDIQQAMQTSIDLLKKSKIPWGIENKQKELERIKNEFISAKSEEDLKKIITGFIEKAKIHRSPNFFLQKDEQTKSFNTFYMALPAEIKTLIDAGITEPDLNPKSSPKPG